MKKIQLLIMILFSCSIWMCAQEGTNVRKELPLGVLAILGGPSFYASAAVSYFINPVLQVEAGAGLIGYFSGVKFHYSGPKDRNAAWYTGAFISHLRMKGVGSVTGIYAPLGWEYIFDFGPSYGIEVAVWHGFTQTTFIWGAVKMGWYF